MFSAPRFLALSASPFTGGVLGIVQVRSGAGSEYPLICKVGLGVPTRVYTWPTNFPMPEGVQELNAKYKTSGKVKKESALLPFRKGSWHFYFALDCTNSMPSALATSNY